MVKKNKSTASNWNPEQDPVWIIDGDVLKPSPFFLRWWEKVAEQRFGDKERWLGIAVELGYIGKFYDLQTGNYYYEPVGFDYDPTLARHSLGLTVDMPLVLQNKDHSGDYQNLWQWLLPKKEG